MKPKSSLHRLPGFDQRTGRWELLVFVSLGIAGIWLAVAAARQAGHFATERDAIAATLTGGQAMARHRSKTKHAATNFTAIPYRRRVNSPAGGAFESRGRHLLTGQ